MEIRLAIAPARRATLVSTAVALCLAGIVTLAHAPGYVSYDAIVQWYDGRYGFTSGYPGHPPLMSLIWGALEWITPGPAPIFLLQMGLFTAALCLLVYRLRLGAILAAVFGASILLQPYEFVNLARINKDVLGGSAVLLAFCILVPPRVPGRDRLLWLAGGLLAGALFVRYQFAAVVPVWLWIAFRTGGSMSAKQGVAGLIIASAGIATWLTVSVKAPSDLQASLLKIIAFDLAGVAVRVPDTSLAGLDAPGVDAAELTRRMRAQYSTAKVDTLWLAKDQAMAMIARIPPDQLKHAWVYAAMNHPGALVAHRFAAFGRVLGLGEMDSCAVVSRAPTAPDPPELAAVLHTDALPRPYSLQVLRWRIFPVESFLFRPVFYALLAGAGLVLTLIWRASTAEMVWARWSLLAGLLYLATFFALPQACDGRYVFFTVSLTLFSISLISVEGVRALRARSNPTGSLAIKG